MRSASASTAALAARPSGSESRRSRTARRRTRPAARPVRNGRSPAPASPRAGASKGRAPGPAMVSGKRGGRPMRSPSTPTTQPTFSMPSSRRDCGPSRLVAARSSATRSSVATMPLWARSRPACAARAASARAHNAAAWNSGRPKSDIRRSAAPAARAGWRRVRPAAFAGMLDAAHVGAGERLQRAGRDVDYEGHENQCGDPRALGNRLQPATARPPRRRCRGRKSKAGRAHIDARQEQADHRQRDGNQPQPRHRARAAHAAQAARRRARRR